eukprot:gene32399-2562_t
MLQLVPLVTNLAAFDLHQASETALNLKEPFPLFVYVCRGNTKSEKEGNAVGAEL